MTREKAIKYLYLPYLGIVVAVLVASKLLNLLFSTTLNWPAQNGIIVSIVLMTVVLLALYRPVMRELSHAWSGKAQGFPVDIFLAIPAAALLQISNVSFILVLIAFVVGQLIWLLVVALSSRTEYVVSSKYEGLDSDQLRNKIRSDLIETFEYFVIKPGYRFTPIIACVMSGIFFLMMLSGANGLRVSPESLYNWGSAFKVMMTSDAQDWRLITAGFLHNGIMQLVITLAGLVFCARLLEKAIGSYAVMTIFIISLITANVAAFEFGSAVHIFGSHYAVMGFAGAMFFYALFEIASEETRGTFAMTILVVVPMTVFVEYLVTYKTAVNVAGLLGGFLGGIMTSIYYIPAMRRAPDIEP